MPASAESGEQPTAETANRPEALPRSVRKAKLLKLLVDPARFPALGRVIAAGVFDQADEPYDEFVFGLDRILDGVGLLIAQRADG